jgi:competence protein ComEC
MRRPIFYVTLCLIFGIVAEHYVRLPFSVWTEGCLLFLMISLACIYFPRACTCFVLLAFFVLGAVLSSQSYFVAYDDVSRVAHFYSKESVQVEGLIVADVEKRRTFRGEKTTFVLDIKRLRTKVGWRTKSGRVLVNVFRPLRVYYGDYVVITGKLHWPFNFDSEGNFSYRDYLRHQGIRLILSVKKDAPVEILNSHQASFFKEISLKIRDCFRNVLSEHLTENESGIMQAVLLGDRTNIPKHVRELFVRTGTAHILAISGLHIGIITGLIFLFLKLLPIGRRPQLIFTIMLVIAYAFLTGGRPSVVRATIIAVTLLFSLLVERETDSVNSLSLAAFLILLVNPLNLFDIGFQLSFISVLGILWFCPWISRHISSRFNQENNRVKNMIIQAAAVSSAAWIGVLGLIAYYFQIITPVTLIANLLIVPFISLIIALGLGLMIFGLMWPAIALSFGYCLKLALNMMVFVIYLADLIPGSCLYIKTVTLLFPAIYYIFVILLYFFGLKLTK